MLRRVVRRENDSMRVIMVPDCRGLRRILRGAAALACVAAVSFSAVANEASVRPGANRYYLAPDLDVDTWVQRFEGESREVFARRHAIVAALGVEPGQAVADVGAGTGLFVPLLARQVGDAGHVFAADIVPEFVALIRDRVAEAGLAQVTVVLSAERSVTLPPRAVDLVFTCDVYHHFEYPRSVLASIRRALKSGGTFVIVDFERIPGQSRRWILGHVRAGRDAVIAEVTEAGFVFEGAIPVEGLEENYMLRFTAP